MMMMTTSRASSLATNAASLHSNSFLASFLSPSLPTQWPLRPPQALHVSPPLTASHPNTPKVTFCVGLNILEGDDSVLEAGENDDFVEVGLICSMHGVKGELKAISRTDFPEQRFEQPGIRWVGFYRMGKFVGVRQVELISGRKIIQGKEPAWLLSFQGFETLEKARELLGAIVLVKNTDRPALSTDQFYLPDLIGMSVQLKDSGEVIGSIVDVYNSGASDLLRVKLSPLSKDIDGKDEETKESLVWIPFVEEIVPLVDRQARRVEIVPPKGLLELNLPSKRPLKQELRKQALKTKRKLQERISGVKKRVLALKQGHILSGLALGDGLQKEALRAQLLDIDFKLFKLAIETSFKDPKLSLDRDKYSFPSNTAPSLDWTGLKAWLGTSPKDLECSNEVNKLTWNLWLRGLELVAEGRVAIVALPTGELTENNTADASLKLTLQYQAQQLLSMQELTEMILGKKPLIPWVVVTTEASEECTKALLRDEVYFGLTEGQVSFVKLSCLPYISSDAKDGLHEILMESQWRIITGPGGEGLVIGDLDDSGVLNNLVEMGIDYIHVCATNKSTVSNTDPVIFGLMKEQEASVAVKVTSGLLEGDHGILCLQEGSFGSKNHNLFKAASGRTDEVGHFIVLKPEDLEKAALTALEDSKPVYRVSQLCNYTYSVEYFRHLSQQRYRFVYEAVLKSAPHMEMGSDRNNAMQLKCSLHSSLLFCPSSKVALLECDPEES